MAGIWATPAIGSPLYSRPTSVAQIGTPRMKLRVPSMGSMIQRKPELPGVAPDSSPRKPSCGNRPSSVFLSRFSAPRSASVTGLLSGFHSTATFLSK